MSQQSTPAAKLADGYLLTDTELAALFGVALSTVRNWRSRGEGPQFVKLGRCVRYKAEAVREFLKAAA